MMTRFTAIIATLMSGALFGFFYAWVCSSMYGLDATDPRVAIQAMQAINDQVRNAVFFPVFFLTSIALLVAAVLLHFEGQRRAGLFFGLAAVSAGVFATGLTMVVHVPLNEELAALTVPDDLKTAQEIWGAYSPDWQFWNIMRTIASGLALALAALGLMEMAPKS